MKAEYFLNRLNNHRLGPKSRDYTLYDDDTLLLYRTSDKSSYYEFDRSFDRFNDDEYITKRYMTSEPDNDDITFDDIKDFDDFELYSDVQSFQLGYLKINNKNSSDVIKLLNDYLCQLNDILVLSYSNDDNKIAVSVEEYVDIIICTNEKIKNANKNRFYFDLAELPVDDQLANQNSLYVVCFRDTVGDSYDEKIRNINLFRNSDIAIKKLLGYMKEIDVECEYVEINSHDNHFYL